MMRDSLRVLWLGLVVLGVASFAMMPVSETLAADGIQTAFQIEVEAQPPSVLDHVDQAFAKAVEHMSVVLFFRIGQSERTYVQFQQTEYFVREVGSDGAFTKLDSRGQVTDTALDERDVQRRMALCKPPPCR